MGAAPEATMSENTPTLNPGFIRELLGDDHDSIVEFVGPAMEEIEDLASKCAAAARAGEIQQAGSLAHAVKGAAANLGGERLCACAAEAERAGKAGDATACAAAAVELPALAAALRDAVRAEGWAQA